MKLMAIFILLFSQAAWSKVELSIGAAAVEQFTFKEVSDDPSQLLIFTNGSTEGKILDLKYAIINMDKVTVTIPKGGKDVAVEMLIVSITTGARTQSVQLYSPTNKGELIVGKNISPLCSLDNHGDFSWDSPEELRGKLDLVEKKGSATLSIMVKSVENGPRAFTECVSFKKLKK